MKRIRTMTQRFRTLGSLILLFITYFYLLGLSPAFSEGVNAFEFAAFGDIPYEPGDVQRVERLIQSLNTYQPAFSVHVGDIKSGKSLCSDRSYKKVQALFRQFTHPFVYTPGDNEWTDCHRFVCGSYRPVERLKKIRELFFTEPLAPQPDGFIRQGDVDKAFPVFTENSRWQKEKILFVAVHQVGSNNNRQKKHGSKKEFKQRNKANMKWLNQAFDEAERQHLSGVVIFMHALPLFYAKESDRSGLSDFHALLKKRVPAFNGQVLLVHGDAHFFKVDKPLRHSNGKAADELVRNFTRVNIFGSPDVAVVRILVDPTQPDLFTIRPFLPIKENF